MLGNVVGEPAQIDKVGTVLCAWRLIEVLLHRAPHCVSGVATELIGFVQGPDGLALQQRTLDIRGDRRAAHLWAE